MFLELRPGRLHTIDMERRTTPAPDPDTLLEDRQWLGLVQECVELYDELDESAPHLDRGGQQMAAMICARLRALLQDAGVTVIEGETRFDRHRHRPVPSRGGIITGSPIIETLSPGFAVGRRVLRRAAVRLHTPPRPPAGEGIA
jgi:molecular chaperone GrpE (heat shock protein)